MITFFCSSVFFVCFVFSSNNASAQLFGNRDISSNRNERAVDSSTAVTGAERFVRGNRKAGDFVGTSRSEDATFVGAAKATGAVTRSVTGLAEPAEPAVSRVNVPRIPSLSGMYAERLTIAFEPIAGGRYRLPPKTKLSDSLRTIVQNRGLKVQLSLSNSAVTLRGKVDSPQQKRLAELLVLFEPGIGTVTNELNVMPNLSR